jgi:ATP-dependent helicase/DNAse subunit B
VSSDNVLIIFPTQHLVRQYRDECIRGRTGGAASINAMTFDDLVDRCIPQVKGMTYIDDIYRRTVVDAIMRGYTDTLSYFKQLLPGYIWTVAQDIGELKMAGITPDEFKKLWLADDNAHWAKDLYEVYNRYEELLRQHRLYDKEDRYIMAAEAVSKGMPPLLHGVKPHNIITQSKRKNSK